MYNKMEIAKVANFLLNSSSEEFSASLTGTMLNNEVEKTELLIFKNKLDCYKTTPTQTASTNPKYHYIHLYLDILARNRHTNGYNPITDNNLKNCKKTSPCPCCGECASFKRDYIEFVHSKKNCPYTCFYISKMGMRFFNIDDVKLQHKYIMTFNQIASKWIVKKFNTLNSLKDETDKKINTATKLVKDEMNLKVNELTTKYEETDKELKLFHRIMPVNTIEKRKEEYENRKKELDDKENNIVLKIKECEDAVEKIETATGLSQVNEEMRNIKIKNMQHKFDVKYIKLENENEVINKDNILCDERIKTLVKQVADLKQMAVIESEGFEDMEKLNEKMYDILKKQKKIPDETCSICMDCIIDENMTLKCGHHFHSSCYMKYCLSKCRSNENGVDGRYIRTYKCPNCRGNAVVLDNY